MAAMASKYETIDLARIKTVSIAERGSKVKLEQFGAPLKGGKSFKRWLHSLPGQLAADRIRELATLLRRSKTAKDHELVWMLGAHVVKCGLSLYFIELMKRGFVTSLAMNGAAAIHDFEIAWFGETSEDVALNLSKGIFGFSRETAAGFSEAVADGISGRLGLGEAIGSHISKKRAPNRHYSLLGEAYRLGIPATVHAAIGTDILVQHPNFDGSQWGELSGRDFRILAARIEKLGRQGGVVLNVGSAVIMPEVFLKAFSIARNLGAAFERITTCNLDMIQHYRPLENVVKRPSSYGGRGFSITGHHEVVIPLLFSALHS
jgi:hypothetical protein